jgi:hypothetical protein
MITTANFFSIFWAKLTYFNLSHVVFIILFNIILLSTSSSCKCFFLQIFPYKSCSALVLHALSISSKWIMSLVLFGLPASYLMGTRVIMGVRQGRYSSSSSIKFKNKWKYTPRPHLCHNDVKRDVFTFYFNTVCCAVRIMKPLTTAFLQSPVTSSYLSLNIFLIP